MAAADLARFIKALRKRNLEEITELIDKNSLDFNEVDVCGKPLVVYLFDNMPKGGNAAEKQMEIIRTLDRVRGLDWNRHKPDGCTALMMAVADDQFRRAPVDFLLARLTPEQVNTRNAAGTHAFYYACWHAGADTKNDILEAFLEWAVKTRKLSLAVDRNSPETKANCFLPLKPSEVIKSFVRDRLGAARLAVNVDWLQPISIETPFDKLIHTVLYCNDKETVEAEIDKASDEGYLCQGDADGLTPLMWAIAHQRRHGVLFAVEAMKDVNQKDCLGRTAAHYAIYYGVENASLLVLMNHNSLRFEQDNRGRFPGENVFGGNLYQASGYAQQIIDSAKRRQDERTAAEARAAAKRMARETLTKRRKLNRGSGSDEEDDVKDEPTPGLSIAAAERIASPPLVTPIITRGASVEPVVKAKEEPGGAFVGRLDPRARLEADIASPSSSPPPIRADPAITSIRSPVQLGSSVAGTPLPATEIEENLRLVAVLEAEAAEMERETERKRLELLEKTRLRVAEAKAKKEAAQKEFQDIERKLKDLEGGGGE